MRTNLVIELSKSFFTCLLVAVVAAGHGSGQNPSRPDGAAEMPDFSFTLTRTPEDPKRYSLVLSDDQEHVISGTFSIEQLQILRAMMVEAGKFAFTEEAVGTKQSVTTRFLDKQERAFVVDVEKLGNQSRLYLTISTEAGRMTAEGGRINRSVRRSYGFLFDLSARLESTLPKLPTQPNK
ncbi:MAG: hypothetical protein AABO57_24275 [Acidobacteriota bacterium]